MTGGNLPAEAAELTDEQLVEDAVQARGEAEETELEVSPSRWREADDYAALSQRGWSYRKIAAECNTNHGTVGRFVRCVDRYRSKDQRPTFWTAYSEITGEGKLDPMMSSATPEWGTPQDLFDELDAEFHFTLDVCATPELAKCKDYFAPDDDGLAQDWTGVCWMNPPYGKEIPDWIAKASESARAGATVVCLVPARVDTGWWFDYCRYGEMRFLRGRLTFEGAEAGAPFPSAVVIFRPGAKSKVVWWER